MVRKSPRGLWLAGSVVLLVLGVVIGLILENVWLGLLLAILVSLGWLLATQSRKSDNAGINDEDHGIEL